MDLIRSWFIAAAVLLGANLTITLVVNQHLSAAYLLGPFLAGAASSFYHAERGVGAWGRHLLAVLPVPAAFQAYRTLVQDGLPGGGPEWGSLVMTLGVTTVITGLGLGAVMLTRLLLMTRGSAEADSELS